MKKSDSIQYNHADSSYDEFYADNILDLDKINDCGLNIDINKEGFKNSYLALFYLLEKIAKDNKNN